MPITGKAEEVQLQQSVYLSKAIPIKKRRFPVIRGPSPPPESLVGSGSKEKLESNTPDQGSSLSDARSAASPGNSVVNKTDAIAARNEYVAFTNVALGQSNVGNLASKIPNDELSSSSAIGTISPGNSVLNKTPAFIVKNEEVAIANIDISYSSPENTRACKLQEAKAPVDVGSLCGSRSKLNVLPNEKPAEPRVPGNFMTIETRNVKQEMVTEQVEGVSKVQESTPCPMNAMTPMNIELSLGLKEPVALVLGRQASESIHHNSEMSHPLLSLALTKGKHVLHYNNDIATGSASSLVSANWDLNTTMDVWGEGSSNSHELVPRFVDIGRLSKAESCSDVKSSLTTDGTDGLSSDRAKHNLNDNRSHTCYSSVKPCHQFTTDDSLGLRLSMPFSELGSSGNVNMSVKSEPIDENLNHDCSIGSCSSSNKGLLKVSSLKRELVNDSSLGTASQSNVARGKLVANNAIKTEVAELGNKIAHFSDDAVLTQSVARVMQHQKNRAASSALPVALMPENPSSSMLPSCSESTAVGDFLNNSEQSFQCKEFHNHGDNCDEQVASMVSKPFGLDDKCSDLSNVGKPELLYPESCNVAQVDDRTLEFRQSSGAAATAEEKMILAEMSEVASLGSNCESKENCAIEIPKVIQENVASEEDEECEDGEVQESVQQSAVEDPIIEGKMLENLDSVIWEPQNLQSSVLLGGQNMNPPDFEVKFTEEEKHGEIHRGTIKDCLGVSRESNCEDNSLKLKSNNLLELGNDEKRSINASADRILATRGEDVENNPAEKVFCCEPTNGSHCIDAELCDKATDKVVDVMFSGESSSTSVKVETPSIGHHTAKESHGTGSKSRIISLPCTAVAPTPGKTRSIPGKILTPESGEERDSDVDGKLQPRENSLFYRDEIYKGGRNKFGKDRVLDSSLWNSRSSFVPGKGRVPGRFGLLHGEWDSGHDFVSKNYNGPPDYQFGRRKHSSNNSDVELDCNGYGISQDDTSLVGTRRKFVNGEFTSMRQNSLRRLSTGERDCTVPRSIQMISRIPRKMSPSRSIVEDGSNVVEIRHVNMRHLSDDIVEPMYGPPLAMYDKLEGSRNFSSMHRKGYPQIRSKSPFGPRARSPGPWRSLRRGSPVGPPEMIEHRSPGMYRMGRMRSPDHTCYREEMFPRRQQSPSYMGRHANELRDVDSGCGHVHPRPTNSNRRTSPGQVFPSSSRRAEALDSREMGDGDDEYINVPLHSHKFHELHRDGYIDDEQRKFIKRLGPRSFHSNYRGGNNNFHLHQNVPRQYRFCPDMDPEFVDRSNRRERELDAHMKHQPPRRIRNIEDLPNGNYGPPIERGWHDDGFTESRLKRRRF